MGKFKQYTEPEIVHLQTEHRRSASTPAKQRIRKAAYTPVMRPGQSPESLPVPVLFQLLLLRLRRNWVALRFQCNRYTYGLLAHKTALKLVTLMAAAWFLLFNQTFTLVDEASSGKAMGISFNLFETKTGRRAKENLPRNEAAPVGANQLTEEMALDYIARYHKTAIGEMEKFGIPASISLAQGLVESRAGDSKLARQNNNHFGMKCFSRSCRKDHCSNFTDDTHKDFFRKFKSPWDSWRAHSQMLASGRYAKLKKHGRDYRQWAYGLKSLGYATDRTYAEKLVGIIERYELHKYDQ